MSKTVQIQHISCIIPENQGKGAIYLGNVIAAQDIHLLKKLGIRAILTCSIQTDLIYSPEDIILHKNLDAYDTNQQNLKEYFNATNSFIDRALRFTNVFVHCFAGVSRSVCCVVAYLMKKYQWPLNTGLKFVKMKRSLANPNKNFLNQLSQYEQQLRYIKSNNVQYQSLDDSIVAYEQDPNRQHQDNNGYHRQNDILQTIKLDRRIRKIKPINLPGYIQ